MTDIAETIKKYRKDNSISQQKFGEMIGVSQQAVHHFENGEAYPKYAAMEKIRKVIGIGNMGGSMANHERISAIYERIDTILQREADNPIYDEKDSRSLLNYLQALRILEEIQEKRKKGGTHEFAGVD